jgi:aminodeoxyfutalosine synthase
VISAAELTSLATTHDIISIGMLADDLRRERHGAKTTFVRVATTAADAGAPVSRPPAAGELRIVGVPVSVAAAIERVREVASLAEGAVVTGFSLADLEALSARDGGPLRSLLDELRAAGLELVAEAPMDRLQRPRRSIEAVAIAGLSLARLTVDTLTSPDPLPLLNAVAELQRAVAVVRAFAPLPRRVNPAAPTTGFEDVKHVALARLAVDNVPSIQVDWSLYGPKLAQVALTVGADDVDGVSAEDETTAGRRRAPLEEIRRNIIAAGQEPVERNGRFDILRALDTIGVVPRSVEGRRVQDERAR